MRVLIVSANVAQTPYPVYPLGASVVVGALRDAGHEVTLFDFLQRGSAIAALAEELRATRPEVVGISMRNLDNTNMLSEQRYLTSVQQIVASVREHCGAPVVVGGSGFSVMPERILEEVGADYGICGEGEQAVVELVEAIAAGDPPPRGCIRRPPALTGAGIRAADYDADVLRFYLAHGNTASVQTKRGCTHHCVYCTYPLLEGHEIRPRDPRDVVDDVELLVREHQVQCVFFTDSVFNDDDGHSMAVVDELHRRRIDTRWTAFFKPDRRLDQDQVARMRETGLCAAEVGTDATSDTTLAALGKSFDFDEVVRCNDLFGANDVSAAHYVMFGGPGETEETVERGLVNLARLRAAAIFPFLGIRILPGTPLARLARHEGLIAREEDLLEPAYYISPAVGQEWLEERLRVAFADLPHVVFPPNALEGALRMLHRMGFTGNAIDFLTLRDRTART